MLLKRVAIILGSPFPHNSQHHLRGVSSDVQNYMKFLMSSSGGAWKRSEIYIGTHIKTSVLPTVQRLCRDADIALIIYSGHGFMRNGNNFININPDQSLNVQQLNTIAKRQITIIDACRSEYPYENLEGIGDIGMYFDNTRPALGRALYDYFLERAAFGRFTMFSSSENQPSQDTENGGLFSYSLLSNVSDWAFNTNKLWLPAHVSFMRTQDELYRRNDEQKPDYSHSGNIIPSIPLCVSPQAYIRSYEPQNAMNNTYRTTTVRDNPINSKRTMTIRTLS